MKNPQGRSRARGPVAAGLQLGGGVSLAGLVLLVPFGTSVADLRFAAVAPPVVWLAMACALVAVATVTAALTLRAHRVHRPWQLAIATLACTLVGGVVLSVVVGALVAGAAVLAFSVLRSGDSWSILAVLGALLAVAATMLLGAGVCRGFAGAFAGGAPAAASIPSVDPARPPGPVDPAHPAGPADPAGPVDPAHPAGPPGPADPAGAGPHPLIRI